MLPFQYIAFPCSLFITLHTFLHYINIAVCVTFCVIDLFLFSVILLGNLLNVLFTDGFILFV